jgi:hypothetical protein
MLRGNCSLASPHATGAALGPGQYALSEAFGLAGPPPRGLHIVAGRQCRCAFRRPPDPKFFSMQIKHRDDRPSRRRRLRGNCSLGFISTHSEHRLVRLMGFRLRPQARSTRGSSQHRTTSIGIRRARKWWGSVDGKPHLGRWGDGMGGATDVSLYRSQAGEVPDRRRLRRARAGRVDLALLSASVKTSPPNLYR